PFRSSRKKWPKIRNKPAPFLGQLCTVDSRDLFPDLPGDVLLVFGGNHHGEFALEWVTLDEKDLIKQSEIPKMSGGHDPVMPCHGTIHRTYDLAHGAHEARVEHIHAGWRVPTLEGTKIGGFPFEVQEMEVVPRYLGALGSIQPAGDTPWPWTNQKEPIGLSD